MDLQKFFAKFGELHWPGYQYMGPGTKLAKRLRRGDPGINQLDKIAKQHDIDYSHAQNFQDKWKADTKMIQAIDRLPGKKTMKEHVVKKNYASQNYYYYDILWLLLLLQQNKLQSEFIAHEYLGKKQRDQGLFPTPRHVT